MAQKILRNSEAAKSEPRYREGPLYTKCGLLLDKQQCFTSCTIFFFKINLTRFLSVIYVCTSASVCVIVCTVPLEKALFNVWVIAPFPSAG